MSETNKILGNLDSNTLRVIFLYVGQGEATLVLMPNGSNHHLSMLIDCNRSVSLKGIDLPKLLCDVLHKNSENKPILDVLANTHPHNDHLGGLEDIRNAVDIGAVWHSGHKPSSAHEGPWGELKKLIDSVKKRGGEEKCLQGSRTPLVWGSGEVLVLSPAEYIVEEIEGETPERRDARIHDQCAVLRVSYGGVTKTHILITGDSDKTAWKRITDYHGKPGDNRTQSQILSASHHGSYTFFKDRSDDPEPYEDHLTSIAPERVIISAPDQKDSKHGHPDDYAVERYENAVGTDYVHHMGSRGWSFFVDVSPSGTYSIDNDRGELARIFCFDENKDDGGNSSGGSGTKKPTSVIVSRVEQSRPMGEK